MSDAPSVPVSMRCPNCRQAMHSKDMERNSVGNVRVHLCFSCAGIWFDPFGSGQLAPGAVIELFKEISAHRTDARQPVAGRLNCPHCNEALALNYDLSKAGRFSYFACHRGDGRFTPFFQFLREKQFVRNLTPAEIQRVRSQVRQVTCSECGAPVDLEHDTQCKYCHAPLSFLDPDAVERAMHMWSDADNRRHLRPTPEILGDALLRTQLHTPASASSTATGLNNRLLLGTNNLSNLSRSGIGVDLVAVGIDIIASLFQSSV